MLLMALEYIREYRTYFHISQSYGVSESTAYKTVRWIEDTLIKHPDFALPGRKALLKSDVEYEVVLIDATVSARCSGVMFAVICRNASGEVCGIIAAGRGK